MSAAGSGSDSRAALEFLCRSYWMPLYVYARRCESNAHDAQDLTQAFFERLLEKGFLAEADQNRGRFRSFLLTSFRHFLSNEWDRKRTLKRGGGQQILSLDFDAGEALHESCGTTDSDAETAFERNWAEAVLARVLNRLEREQERAGKAHQFSVLRSFIAGRAEQDSLSSVAADLGLTDAAARMAVSRLRQRYRDILRSEIAETVNSADDIDDEIRHLFTVFAG